MSEWTETVLDSHLCRTVLSVTEEFKGQSNVPMCWALTFSSYSAWEIRLGVRRPEATDTRKGFDGFGVGVHIQFSFDID